MPGASARPRRRRGASRARAESAIRAERLRYAPATLIRSGVFGILATVALVIVLWIFGGSPERSWRASGAGGRDVQAGFACKNRKISRLSGGSCDRARDPCQAARAVSPGVRPVSHFRPRPVPWTRAYRRQLLDYVVTPFASPRAPLSATCRTCCLSWSLPRSSTLRSGSLGCSSSRSSRGGSCSRAFRGMGGPDEQDRQVLLIAFGVVVAFPTCRRRSLPRSPAYRCSSASWSPWRRARRSRT